MSSNMWAASVGYEQVEVAAWPAHGSERRRYAGTAHLPIEDMTADRGSEIVGELADLDISISGLGYYPNNLDPDGFLLARNAIRPYLPR